MNHLMNNVFEVTGWEFSVIIGFFIALTVMVMVYLHRKKIMTLQQAKIWAEAEGEHSCKVCNGDLTFLHPLDRRERDRQKLMVGPMYLLECRNEICNEKPQYIAYLPFWYFGVRYFCLEKIKKE